MALSSGRGVAESAAVGAIQPEFPGCVGQLLIQLSPHRISRTALKRSLKASDTLAKAPGAWCWGCGRQ